MSLFVGNVSKNVSQREFEDEFKSFGSCRVDLRKGFAFVQFQNERNAQQAKKQLQHKNFCGLRFNIEWSKNSGRFNQNSKAHTNNRQAKRSRSRDRSRRRNQDRWLRRSPSHQRRSSPSYSDHDLDTYVPECPRDHELLRILKQKRQQKIKIQLERQRQAEIDGQILNQNQLPLINNAMQIQNKVEQKVEQVQRKQENGNQQIQEGEQENKQKNQ